MSTKISLESGELYCKLQVGGVPSSAMMVMSEGICQDIDMWFLYAIVKWKARSSTKPSDGLKMDHQRTLVINNEDLLARDPVVLSGHKLQIEIPEHPGKN